jgi:hypothetical protein
MEKYPDREVRIMTNILIPAAIGELIDKITILEIKSQRISSPEQIKNIRHELSLLDTTRSNLGLVGADLEEKTRTLKEVNETLWEIEDLIRDCERLKDFGPRFIELARSVYMTNDRRAAVKREINAMFGSTIVEEKSYSDY